MKKYTIFVLFMLMGFSAQAMQRVARSAQAGFLAGRAFQQTRSKVSLATLAQVHRELPRSSFKNSPLLGAANALNGTLSRELKESKLAQSFFNQLAEEPIRYTVADGNPAKYLTSHLLGELLALHSSGELYKKEFFETETFKTWHAQYKGPEDAKGFAAQVRKLLNRMQKESDSEKVREMLLSAVYFQADTAEDLKTFLQASKSVVGVDQTLENKKVMGDYADAFIALTAAKKDMSFLQAEEISEMAGRCGEKALWSVLNMIFYNRETGLLDVTMVPAEIQKSCLPEFASFIATHSNPKAPKFYKEAYKDFLKLVDTIPGVTYHGGKTYEMPGERSETLKIVNHLFGTNAATYQKLGHMLSNSEKRVVSFAEPVDKEYGSMKIMVDDKKAETVFSGMWNFSKGHVYFVFDKKDNNAHERIEVTQILDSALHSHGCLLRLIPGWLHRSIKWREQGGFRLLPGWLHRLIKWRGQGGLVDLSEDHTKQAKEVLKKYKVTKTELNELSPGLGEKKCTVLHTAIETKRADLVNCFLEYGSDPNKADSNGDTPLWLALLKENKSMVQALVSAGAQVNAVDGLGRSYLHKAVSLGNAEMVQMFLDLQVDFTLRTTDYEKTALDLALQRRNKEIAQLLIAAGADIDAFDKDNYWSSLSSAAYLGYGELVQLCLELGANLKSKNKYGETALMQAKSREVVELLISAGAVVDEKDDKGETALMHALKDTKRMEAANALVVAGADINAFDKDNYWSSLSSAVFHGDSALVQLCLELGANPTIKNKHGETALTRAQKSGHTEIVQLLKDAVVQGTGHATQPLKDAELVEKKGRTTSQSLKDNELAHSVSSLSFMERARAAALALKNRLF